LKKIFLIPSVFTLLFPNINFGAACIDGANSDGCTIGTTNTQYDITGDIAPASGVSGIELTPSADVNTISLSGDITTTGTNGYGVYLDNADTNILLLSTSITSTGSNGDAVRLDTSSSNVIELYGNISTSDSSSQGWSLSDSNSNTIRYTGGSLSTAGLNGTGVYLIRSDSNTLTFGSVDAVNISTTGQDADGFFVRESDSNNITITGNIATTGDYADGFNLLNGNSNNFTMTGDITTGGEAAYGIYFSNGTSNTMTMSGNITSTGNNIYGFYINTQTSSSITMSGDITLSDGYGMMIIDSDSNTLTMNGDITSTSGDYSVGAYLIRSDSNTLTVANISAEGTISGDGIYVVDNSDSNEISINGKVSASRYALYANSTSDNNTFTLNQGSVISGEIRNDGTNNTLKLNLGAGRSYALETTGSSSWTIEDLNNRPMVTGSAYGIGVGNMETQGHEMYQRTYQVNQTLQQRQLANYKGNASPYWINSYYNKSSRSGSSNLSSNNLQFSNHRSGINLGYRVTKYEQPFELLFNYENSSMNHDDFNHQISSDSMMAGVFIPKIKQLAGGDLSVNAMLGISDFRGNRQVMTNSSGYSGMRTIGSDYQATHYVVGVGWLKELYQGEMLQTYVNIGADINHQQMESYREEAYYKFNSRDISQLQSRITLSADAQPFKNKLNINVNLGIENRNMIAGTQQGLYLNNTKTGYSHVNQTNTYLTSSLNISYPFTNTISAYAGYQYFDSGDDIKMSSGQIGVSGSF
jgi:hypothetical protein